MARRTWERSRRAWYAAAPGSWTAPRQVRGRSAGARERQQNAKRLSEGTLGSAGRHAPASFQELQLFLSRRRILGVGERAAEGGPCPREIPHHAPCHSLLERKAAGVGRDPLDLVQHRRRRCAT